MRNTKMSNVREAVATLAERWQTFIDTDQTELDPLGDAICEVVNGMNCLGTCEHCAWRVIAFSTPRSNLCSQLRIVVGLDDSCPLFERQEV